MLSTFAIFAQQILTEYKAMKKEKDKSDKKDTAASPSFFRKVAATWHNETLRFIVGLMLVIFSVYLLLAFSSFFFTGATRVTERT